MLSGLRPEKVDCRPQLPWRPLAIREVKLKKAGAFSLQASPGFNNGSKIVPETESEYPTVPTNMYFPGSHSGVKICILTSAADQS